MHFVSHSTPQSKLFVVFFSGISSMLLRLGRHGSEHLRSEIEYSKVLELDIG